MDVLLVDGYNIIGAWPELRELKKRDLTSARDRLLEDMAEYQAYKGYKVIVVFDAHFVEGIEKKYVNKKVEVVFTREKETADERIEKLTSQYQKDIRTQVHVATSDHIEQSVTFGQGALRISARELLNEVNNCKKQIIEQIRYTNDEKPSGRKLFDEEIMAKLDKLRRRK
ncbi:NYN domain-containing protein [Bacillus solimangrovi]|uniref:RNA-binding protein n=1 Tax=Bacillus solimangrovi TaxID=1305675 RepID=A0A1E5LGG8_9BACI|nr:NYN domain-containing protein [Bacillus solimangrovi]OEH93171.1 hypothetical protein BFG57_12920 [Bacillus solimangrovi]